MPTIKTPTIEMIKGVGKYEQHEEIDNAFIENVQEVTPIHGHRNTMRSPSNTTIETEQGVRQIINLEGQVEFGGHLRILELSKVSGSVVSSIIEIKNNNFVEEDNTQQEQTEKTDLQILKELVTSKLIQVKELDENIISLNFTRDAFYDKKWNDLTCTARGLFVDKTNGNIVCRSFSKFFNHKERPETETAGLKQNFVFPVIGYKKENGFLATISKYNGQIRFFTKSTNKGDFVNWFIGVLCDHYNIYGSGSSRIGAYVRYSDIYNRMLQCTDLDQIPYKEELRSLKTQLENKISPYIEEGYSYVFECIDKDNDPHIIKYKENNVYLLQVFKNQLKEEHVSWRELHEIANKLIVPCKSQELRFDNWEQFNTWKDEFTKGVTQWNCKHEGYVFEDANGFQVKFKSSFYKYWKQMRTVKELLQKGKQHLKIYKTKEEIQTIKLLESYTREQLQELSIIDIQQRFYQEYEV
jgi:tRNA splicing ligase